MKRMHLFEWEDQEWFPVNVRNYMTDYLQFVANTFKLQDNILPILKKGLKISGGSTIIDLCSGGGGGLKTLSKDLLCDFPDLKIILTDYYPNLVAFQNTVQFNPAVFSFVENSVDATQCPEDLKGFRTILTGFHHFSPEMATKILADAVEARQPIGIFEITERHPLMIGAMLTLVPMFFWLATPFIRPFSWERMLLTYGIPVVPFFTIWDGVVSCLRTYSKTELEELTSPFKNSGYYWEIGRIRNENGWNNYLLGYPNDGK